MRLFPLLLGLGIAAATAGCDSMPTRVSERFAAPQPKLQVFQGSANATFFAAQAALRRLDFTLTSTALAQGKIEARSRIIPGDSLGGARQFTFSLQLSGPAEGPTEVAAVLKEGTEGDFRAGPTAAALREHGLYSALFAGIETALKGGEAAPGTR